MEHDGKRFAAYINEFNGTPTWIIDTDSLDFTLGSSMNLTNESKVETKADAFVDAHKGVFGSYTSFNVVVDSKKKNSKVECGAEATTNSKCIVDYSRNLWIQPPNLPKVQSAVHLIR